MHWELLTTSIACNIPAVFGATDKGMVDLLKRGSVDMQALQKKHKTTAKDPMVRFPFSSSRKRMSTIIENAHGNDSYNKRLLIKGASELITACCTTYLDANGEIKPLEDHNHAQLKEVIENYAKGALRTIAIAYKDV